MRTTARMVMVYLQKKLFASSQVLIQIIVTFIGILHCSSFDASKVLSCPNSTEWKNRAALLRCPDKMTYHCLPGPNESFYEFCEERHLISNRDGCPQIDSFDDEFDYLSTNSDCVGKATECPNKASEYNSDELFKFPGCFRARKQSIQNPSNATGQPKSIPTSAIMPFEVALDTASSIKEEERELDDSAETPKSTTTFEETLDTARDNDKSERELDDSTNTGLYVIIGILVALVLFLIIALGWCFRRRTRYNSRSKDKTETELTAREEMEDQTDSQHIGEAEQTHRPPEQRSLLIDMETTIPDEPHAPDTVYAASRPVDRDSRMKGVKTSGYISTVSSRDVLSNQSKYSGLHFTATSSTATFEGAQYDQDKDRHLELNHYLKPLPGLLLRIGKLLELEVFSKDFELLGSSSTGQLHSFQENTKYVRTEVEKAIDCSYDNTAKIYDETKKCLNRLFKNLRADMDDGCSVENMKCHLDKIQDSINRCKDNVEEITDYFNKCHILLEDTVKRLESTNLRESDIQDVLCSLRDGRDILREMELKWVTFQKYFEKVSDAIQDASRELEHGKTSCIEPFSSGESLQFEPSKNHKRFLDKISSCENELFPQIAELTGLYRHIYGEKITPLLDIYDNLGSRKPGDKTTEEELNKFRNELDSFKSECMNTWQKIVDTDYQYNNAS